MLKEADYKNSISRRVVFYAYSGKQGILTYLFYRLEKEFDLSCIRMYIYMSWHFHKAVADCMEATHSILANIIYFGNRHLGQSVLIQILNKHILTSAPPYAAE